MYCSLRRSGERVRSRVIAVTSRDGFFVYQISVGPGRSAGDQSERHGAGRRIAIGNGRVFGMRPAPLRLSGRCSGRAEKTTPLKSSVKLLTVFASLKFCNIYDYPTLPSIFTAPKIGSSSRKEEDPIVAQIDRPFLVLTVSLPKRR